MQSSHLALARTLLVCPPPVSLSCILRFFFFFHIKVFYLSLAQHMLKHTHAWQILYCRDQLSF